jgi:hypothetical protein
LTYRFAGSCHCGDVRLVFHTDLGPAEIEIRACQCGFCVRQDSQAFSDPRGLLEIHAASRAAVRDYRFGHGLAEYLFCARCGVYLGAVTETAGGLRGFTLRRLLDDRALFTATAVPVAFDGESAAERQARRLAKWTPTVLAFGQPRVSAR